MSDKPTCTDPAVRAAEFVAHLRAHGMHSAYAARVRLPVSAGLRELITPSRVNGTARRISQ